MSWRPEVLVDGTWSPNGMRFETEDEALKWGAALLQRWFVPTDHRAVEVSDGEPNYRYVEGAIEPIRS